MARAGGSRTRTVVVFGTINGAGLERLRAHGGFTIVEHPDRAPDAPEAAAQADAVIVKMTPIDARLVAAAPSLQFVARHGLGHDTVDLAALSARGIPLALTGDVNSGAVAEHTLAMMLALAKRLVPYDAAMRRGDFAVRDTYAAIELSGRTLLVVGFGRIGRKVARLAQAFGMDVLAYDPFLESTAIAESGATAVADLHDGFARADFVTVHAPRLPGGPLLDAKALAAIKPGGFVINVARGGMVDEAALIAALDAGRLAGAGLDVFEREPPQGNDPVLRHPAILVSPHCAAYTGETSRAMALACARNVIAYFEGRLDPALVVNRETLKNTHREETE